jgi:hypothetical protein
MFNETKHVESTICPHCDSPTYVKVENGYHLVQIIPNSVNMLLSPGHKINDDICGNCDTKIRTLIFRK